MLTILMECRNQEAELAQTLSLLVPAAVDGLVGDVVVLDHGSDDGSARVADAAGCRFHGEWELRDVLESVRGDWLLLLEAGVRLQQGWIGAVREHVASGRCPARFSLVRRHRRPFPGRIFAKTPPLEHGLLLPKPLALERVRSGADLASLASGLKAVRLDAELIPARAARAPA